MPRAWLALVRLRAGRAHADICHASSFKYMSGQTDTQTRRLQYSAISHPYGRRSTHTVRLLAFNPLSVGVVTSKVTVDSWVNGTVVVQFTVQSVRHSTAFTRNGCGIIAFMKTALHSSQII